MWTGNGNVTRQREGRELLPARFPAVCPCEAVCAAFPGWVASLPHPASKAALSRPVSQVYGGNRRPLEPLGRRGVRGTISVQEKAVASPLFTPSRNAGRGNGFVRYLGGNAHYFSNMTWHRFLRRDIGIGMDSPADARCHKRFVCHHRRHYGQFPAPLGVFAAINL